MEEVSGQPRPNGVCHKRDLTTQVSDLEEQLRLAKAQLSNNTTELSPCLVIGTDVSHHIFYLLTDSALPLGSFAYSSGLESFLEHEKHLRPESIPRKETKSATQIALLDKFLCLSVETVAFANIPYLLAAYRNPNALQQLDNDLDASTLCRVASRASQSQGGALLRLWKESLSSAPLPNTTQHEAAANALDRFVKEFGHFAPLWGVVCCATGQDIKEAAYVFLLNHARAVTSAALRMNQSYIGPYHQYAVLGGSHKLAGGQTLQDLVHGCLSRVWDLQPEDAGQVVPAMDIWIGRHDLLYTRVFNS